MIRRLRHKGLKLFYEKDQTKGLNQNHVKRIGIILARLDAASTPADKRLVRYLCANGIHQCHRPRRFHTAHAINLMPNRMAEYIHTVWYNCIPLSLPAPEPYS